MNKISSRLRVTRYLITKSLSGSKLSGHLAIGTPIESCQGRNPRRSRLIGHLTVEVQLVLAIKVLTAHKRLDVKHMEVLTCHG